MKLLYSVLTMLTQSMKHFDIYANKELNIIQNSSKTLKEVDLFSFSQKCLVTPGIQLGI